MNRLRIMLSKIRGVYLIPVLAALYACLAVPRLHYPELTHGDEYQDAMTMITGINYEKFGFLRMRFLPQLDLQQEKPVELYTHYPPFPFIVNGALRSWFGFNELFPFRVIAVSLSFLTLLFWYLFVSRISGSWRVGFAGALFYLCNPFFIYGMDSISEFMYSDVVLMAALCLFGRMRAEPARGKKGAQALMWGLLFALSWITFEYMVFLTLFFAVCSVWLRPRGYPSWKTILLYISAPLAGFGGHLLQNAWYFGSIGAAVQDLVASAAYRVGGAAESALSFSTWWKHVLVRHVSLAFYLPFFLLGLGAFAAYLAYQRLPASGRERTSAVLRYFVILFICGLTWYVCFPSHSYAHAYVHFLVRHLVPAAALGFTAAAMIFWLRCSRAGKVLICIGVAAVAAWGVSASDLPLSADAVNREKDFLLFRESLYRLRNISDPRDRVGLNYHRYPFISYYTDRYCVRYYDKQSLLFPPQAEAAGRAAAQKSALDDPIRQGAALPPPQAEAAGRTSRDAARAAPRHVLPRFFVFLPYAHPATVELLAFLRERYDLVYTSSSVRYPALFFELKKEVPGEAG